MKKNLNFSPAYVVAVVLLTVISLSGCIKESNKKDEEVAGGIYALYSYGGQHKDRKAVLWNNGVEKDLTTYVTGISNTTSSNLYLGGVAVTPSGDVYISGCE